MSALKNYRFSFFTFFSALLYFMVFYFIVFCPQYLFSASLSSIPADQKIDFWSDYPAELLADEITRRMTEEELLAQILMFGWAGEEPSPLLRLWVSQRELGSVKVFGWNTDNIIQVAKSVTLLQKKALSGRFRIPLYVATDQEGGLIRHIKGKTSDTPGNLAIGASAYPMDAWYTGYYIGQELRALGINMNFAPTVDLYTNPASTVIGSRSFGINPQFVGVMGASFAAGSMAAGVIPTAKHFPGHGDTGADSHGKLPVINIDYETLLTRELIPFEYLVKEKIPAIMSGHLSFPNILPSGEPASLSHFFLTEILRNKLGFDGLIITDDIMMNGATTYTGAVSAAIKLAIEAGNDIIISSTTAQWEEPLWRNNIALMKTDKVFRQTVLNAAKRVVLSKLKYFKSKNPVALLPDIDSIASLVPAPQSKEFFTAQAARSITLYKSGDFPYKPETAAKHRILAVAQFQDFFDKVHERYTNTRYFFFGYVLDSDQIREKGEELTAYSKNYDTIIICVANETGRRLARYLANSGKRIIIISVLEPVHALDLTWADSIILAYSYSPFSFRAAFSALAGDFRPDGVLPMSIP